MNPSESSPRTVLITGGSKGIGFAAAGRCLQAGCRVILVARDLAGLERARGRLEAAGHDPARVFLQVADVADWEGQAGWVEGLPWLREGLWGLVLNAAVEVLDRVESYAPADLLATVKVNILAPIRLLQLCYPALRRAGGNVVYVGSVADAKREARYSVYGGSKAFMRSFVGHAGQELGFDGMRINVVSPGATETELMRHMREVERAWPQEQIEAFQRAIPIEQRNGTPEEMAEGIWFALAGPRYFHGEDLRIYGGHP